MPHVLVAGKQHPNGLRILERNEAITFDYVETISEASYIPLIDRADALIIRTQLLSADTVARAERLKLVARFGVGYDNIDVDALTRRGILLATVGDANSRAVAEHAMMLLLAASRRLISSDRAVRAGEWEYRNGLLSREIYKKRLLIVGYGRIGRLLAQLAVAFGMEIDAYDPFLDPADVAGDPVRVVPDLRAALAEADFVSVHVPKLGKAVIGAEELGLVKPGVVLINTARSGVIDEAALSDAVKAGRIGGAGLDVFETEPPAIDHPFLSSDCTLLTPHSAALTAECAERMSMVSAQNVVDFFAGSLDPARTVNKEAISLYNGRGQLNAAQARG